jgi:phosphoserine phosphatase RsbU/P
MREQGSRDVRERWPGNPFDQNGPADGIARSREEKTMMEREFDKFGSLCGVPPAQPMRNRTNRRREFRNLPGLERLHTSDQPERYRLDLLTASQRCWLEQDLARAAEVQRELLPDENLSVAGWEISYRYQALGPVGGDYCDIMVPEPRNTELMLALGDASGKGLAASLLMAQLHAIFRSLGPAGLPVQELVERANQILCRHAVCSSFATLICVRATSEGDIEICNAGHCLPLVVGPAGVAQIDSGGFPLGMFPDASCAVTRMRLAKGESLILYTDGVTEARDDSDDEYGADRLRQTVQEGSALPPQELIETCMRSVAAFQAGVPSNDDVTLMAMRYD